MPAQTLSAQAGSLPVELRGSACIRYTLRFLLDPIATSMALTRRRGTFVRLHPPISGRKLPPQVIFAANPSLYKEILGQPAVWRTVNITAGGPSKTASTRLAKGIVRMRGRQHAHYRRLIVPPLKRANVRQLDAEMVQIAHSVISAWPLGERLDLAACVRDLMQALAIGLLFGGDQENGKPVADLINENARASMSLKVNAFPLKIPGTPYTTVARSAERLERLILDWAGKKRGTIDPHDLLSIVVNNNDEHGRRPHDDVIVGHVPTLLGAAYETCQNAMIWSLVLLAGHPAIAAELKEEIGQALNGGPPALDKLEELQVLDQVVKESMRILPPVPNQYRVALEETGLGEATVPKGSRAVLSAFALNRDPDRYPEPERFRPARWETINPSPFEYAAFSAGPRGCPGFYFGNSVVKVALATILSAYSVELVEKQKIDYRVGVTLRPAGPILAVLHPANEARPPVPFGGKIKRLVEFPTLPN